MSAAALLKADLDERKHEERFRRLAAIWKEETKFISSTTQMSMNFAYQQIIGMGALAVPFILRELERKPDHWSWALMAITGENPMPQEAQGNIRAQAEAWLSWGREHGYIH